MKATRRKQRVTMDQLEAICRVNPGSQIEVDEDAGLAFLTLDRPKREYHATLPASVTP